MDYLIYNLADTHLQAQADATLLSDDERATAAKRGRLGGRYLLTRCLLRRELARRLGCPSQSVRFRYSEQGKPECEGGGIHFNLSHSGDCLAIAFDATPIGIDVERMRPRKHLEALAARIMCPEQLAVFREHGCPADEFYTCWCAAEALVKQQAGSIWQATQHPFLCEHGRIRLLAEDSKAEAGAPSRLTVTPFTPLPGYAGAVAYLHL